jgi:hypothetical protein
METNSPILNSIDRSNPFKVPDGYFDKILPHIQESISEKKHIPVYLQKPVWLTSLVVTCSICLLIYFTIFNSPEPKTDVYTSDFYLQDIDEATLYEYLLSSQSDDNQKAKSKEVINFLQDEAIDLFYYEL